MKYIEYKDYSESSSNRSKRSDCFNVSDNFCYSDKYFRTFYHLETEITVSSVQYVWAPIIRYMNKSLQQS